MMRRWARALAPLLLLLTAAPALAQPAGNGKILFVKGRIEAAEYLGGLMDDDTAAKNGEPFIDGADYRVQLRITQVLIGQPRRPELYLTLTITDAPPGDAHPDIFLLLKQEPEGQIAPIDWDFAENGVCIDEDTARAYGIENAIKAIRNEYPCKLPD
jgi:hypothetical protein